MSWMMELYKTYDNIVDRCRQLSITPPWPISHFVKNSHIEVVIDSEGNYLKGRSKVLNGLDSPTLIPATEASAGRAGSKIAPHPLCEEISYCALDFPNANKGKINAYLKQLNLWVHSERTHPTLKAIYKYLQKGTLWCDLTSEFDFPLKVKKTDGSSHRIKSEKVFIRWRVEKPGETVTGTWEDDKLIDSWIAFDRENHNKEGFCYIFGKKGRIAINHSRFLRHPGDGAKLISSNDNNGFTFRGRFTDTKTSIGKLGIQAVGIGFVATQKAHNALRWLITNHGTKIGYSNNDAGSVILAWAVSGEKIPHPMENTLELFTAKIQTTDMPLPMIEKRIDQRKDLGQFFSEELKKYMAGYKAKLDATDKIIIMGLNSATPGRMAVTYYQEYFPDDFIEVISKWHRDFAWYQRHTIVEDNCKSKPVSKTVWSISSPSPRSIWEAIYGTNLNDALKKSTVERILPCIVEARPFPLDLVNKAVQKACNRGAYKAKEQWLWEKHLGIACSLFRGFSKRNQKPTKEYSMALEQNNNSRDYLYGRLLAIAERLEDIALYVSGESRSTTAARLMQRFADRPASTWRNIELALQPYIQRLKNNRAGFLHNMQALMDEVMNQFSEGDFMQDKPLSGEFLLAFHNQRMALHKQSQSSDKTATS